MHVKERLANLIPNNMPNKELHPLALKLKLANVNIQNHKNPANPTPPRLPAKTPPHQPNIIKEIHDITKLTTISIH